MVYRSYQKCSAARAEDCRARCAELPACNAWCFSAAPPEEGDCSLYRGCTRVAKNAGANKGYSGAWDALQGCPSRRIPAPRPLPAGAPPGPRDLPRGLEWAAHPEAYTLPGLPPRPQRSVFMEPPGSRPRSGAQSFCGGRTSCFLTDEMCETAAAPTPMNAPSPEELEEAPLRLQYERYVELHQGLEDDSGYVGRGAAFPALKKAHTLPCCPNRFDLQRTCFGRCRREAVPKDGRNRAVF